eukprot:2046528-Ditylum_brightwellii.AAC.1
MVFLTEGQGEKEGEEEIVPLAGGGKVRPYIKCNKCGKKGCYANSTKAMLGRECFSWSKVRPMGLIPKVSCKR